MAKDKIVILHIGLHKTASTTLQHFFLNYEKQFNDNDVFFPLAGRCSEGIAHHNLALELCNHNNCYSLEHGSFSDLEDEIKIERYNKIILSSEDFEFESDEGRNPAFFKSFFERLGYTVYVLAFVREQHEYLDSEYAEQMKYGLHSLHFKEFIEGQLSKRRYNYVELFKHWKLIFGDNLLVLPFEKVQWNTSIEMYFLNNLPIKLSLKPFEKFQTCFVNERLSSKAIEILRIVTYLCNEWKLTLSEKESVLQQAHTYIARMNKGHENFSGLNRILVKRIRNYFLDSNNSFAKIYMNNKEKLFIRKDEELYFRENIFTFFTKEKKYLPELTTIINYCFQPKYVDIFSESKSHLFNRYTP